jgi:CHASE3 domain sensor protein
MMADVTRVLAARDPGGEQWLRSSRVWISAVAALLCVGALLAVGGLSVEQRTQAPAQTRLRSELRPAHVDVERLLKGYDDQETALRGFLLTGEPDTLQTYTSGAEEVQRLLGTLGHDLADYAEASARLDDVQAVGQQWLGAVAEPQLAARSEGELTQEQLVEFVAQGKQVFDGLRKDIAALSTEISGLIAAELGRFDSAQNTARALQRSALVVILLGAVLVAVVLWRMTSRPLRRLVDAVEAVAEGDYTRSVPQGGPQEYAQLGRAVERMRRRLLLRSDELAAAQRQVTVLAERERIAEGLQDLTIQRVFALGMRLSSLSSQGRGASSSELQALVADTDMVIKELRGVIVGPDDGHAVSLEARAEEDSTSVVPSA